MAGKFLVLEAVNLFCGDDDPTASKHLTISELQLPTLQEIFQDHHPGGSRVGIEVGLGIEKLTASFSLVGMDEDLYSKFGVNDRAANTFTAYGSLRDKRTGVVSQAKAIMRGKLGQIEQDGFQRGNLVGHNYAINEILHYELYIGGSEKVFWDFFAQELRQNGSAQNADERRALGLI